MAVEYGILTEKDLRLLKKMRMSLEDKLNQLALQGWRVCSTHGKSIILHRKVKKSNETNSN